MLFFGGLCEIFFYEGFHSLGRFCYALSVLTVKVKVRRASVHANPMSSLMILVSSV